jgi:hypothetical protein
MLSPVIIIVTLFSCIRWVSCRHVLRYVVEYMEMKRTAFISIPVMFVDSICIWAFEMIRDGVHVFHLSFVSILMTPRLVLPVSCTFLFLASLYEGIMIALL